MSVCIIYASKYGSAKKVAGLISEKLGGCDIFNIAEDSFDLSKYNFVIIGSDIRMGTVDKLITKLLFRFIKPLSERKCAYFLTCIFPENGDGYFKRNIPSQLLSEAVAVAAIGGELDFKRLRGADRFAANMILKAEREKDVYKTFSLDADKISDFVDKLKPQL